MSRLIKKRLTVILMLALGVAPLQQAMGAVPAHEGHNFSMLLLQDREASSDSTVETSCLGSSETDDRCVGQFCSDGHCGVCSTAVHISFAGVNDVGQAPRPAAVSLASDDWWPPPFFRPPRD